MARNGRSDATGDRFVDVLRAETNERTSGQAGRQAGIG